MKGWQCPDCGRRFVQRTREHSCSLTTLQSHLERTSPVVRETFDAIVSVLDSIGPFEIEPLKTMVVLRKAGNFAGVTFTRSRLDLGLFLPRVVSHHRIHRVEQISPVKSSHHVRLATPEEVDAEIESWLREAWEAAPDWS